MADRSLSQSLFLRPLPLPHLSLYLSLSVPLSVFPSSLAVSLAHSPSLARVRAPFFILAAPFHLESRGESLSPVWCVGHLAPMSCFMRTPSASFPPPTTVLPSCTLQSSSSCHPGVHHTSISRGHRSTSPCSRTDRFQCPIPTRSRPCPWFVCANGLSLQPLAARARPARASVFQDREAGFAPAAGGVVPTPIAMNQGLRST